ncbi:MAG: alginate export family protein [Methylococcaceae bacterium]
MSKQLFNLPLSATLLSLSVASSSAYAVGVTQAVEDALNFYHYGKNGAVKFDLNYRYENVNQEESTLKTANANTARLRLGFLSPNFHGLQAYAEYEGNLSMQEDYNSTRNGETGFSTVPDPSENELNQLWLSYAGIPDTIVKGGRQRIKLDDDRFIGNVGWRQMETTFDSVLVTHNNQQIFGLVVNAGYIGKVQTFTNTIEKIDAPFLNVNYKVGDYGNVTAYGYWLDYTETENYEKSSQTYGLRANCCAKPLESIKLSENFGVLYTAEWGHQSDYGHGATSYDADRFNIMGGLSAYNVIVQGAMEQLNGSGLNKHFDTPLGTNHAFQGWADLFLVTPNNGIRDVFATVMVPFQRGDLVFTGVYHDFSDDTGSLDFGDEWDFQVVQKFGKHYSLLAKYALYNGGSDPAFNNTSGVPTLSSDTQKIWVQGNISF